jgi:hypothetical protein
MPSARPVIIYCPIVLLLCLLAGCATQKPKFIDLPPSRASWTEGRRLWSDGRTLHVAIDDDPRGLYVSRIDYQVHDGNLYLATVRQSRPFSRSTFEIDTQELSLNHPWQDHVYWIADVRWDDVGKRAGDLGTNLGQRVDRVKADVLVDPPAQQSLAHRPGAS